MSDKYPRQPCPSCRATMNYVHPSPCTDPAIEAEIGRLQTCEICWPTNLTYMTVWQFWDVAGTAWSAHKFSVKFTATGSQLIVDGEPYGDKATDGIEDWLRKTGRVK